MWVTEWTNTLSFKINDKFSFNFDELQNIKLVSRKSNVWFTDDSAMMITMRNWTAKVWQTVAWSWWVSNQYFFTDFFRTRWHIKWYSNKIWVLKNWVWADQNLAFTWNNFKFNTISLPLMSDWSLPTQYVTPWDSPWAEQVKKSLTDTTTNTIWKFLIITDDPNNNQSYRWCYWYIIEDDWVNYTLNWAWISTLIKNWAKYQIYDIFWEHIQICNWVDMEQYIFVKSDWTFVVNTYYTWLVTKNLRNVRILSSTQYLSKQVHYANWYFVFNKWFLFYSSWYPNNPFFYDFNSTITIPWTNWWYVTDIFIYKWRLIIWWNNYIWYLKWAVETINWVNLINTPVDMITTSYWMKANSLVDLWLDAYYISTNNSIYSLSETITWAIHSTNVWKQMANYLKNFNYWICSWYDWRNLYFYGQKDQSTAWTIIVLDIEYKFWSTYTWLRPSSIILENWAVYLSDNNSDTVRYFVEWQTTDINQPIEQKVSLKDIDLSDPFSQKLLTNIYLWLDNYNQSLLVDTYMSWVTWNTKKNTKKITIQEAELNWISWEMWEWIIWEWLLWWFAWYAEATYPNMRHIQYDSDTALIWKIILTWFEWSPFYLNWMDIELWFSEKTKTYFSPENSI